MYMCMCIGTCNMQVQSAKPQCTQDQEARDAPPRMPQFPMSFRIAHKMRETSLLLCKALGLIIALTFQHAGGSAVAGAVCARVCAHRRALRRADEIVNIKTQTSNMTLA